MPRPVGVDGKVEVPPDDVISRSVTITAQSMCRRSVTFLIKVKECIEDPKKTFRWIF